MQDHHPIAEFPANLAYRLRQVGIVGDNQRRIKGFVEGVDQQPGRQVDIRSLLFNLEHLHQRRRRGRCRERMPRQLHRFPRIRALMEMQAGQRPQCPEVGTLPDMLIGIVGIGPDPGGEIMNILDLASGKRQLAEGTQVQPLIWGIHQAAVISIESVDVDVQDHAAWTVKSKGRPSGRPCYPTTEVVRGIYHQHVARKALRSNLFPEPPTEGATHFLAPHLRRPVRVTALRRAGVFAFEPGPASRQHAPTPEWCPRPEPLGRNGPSASHLCHKVSGPFRAPSALPSQWIQGREMDEWRSVRTKPAARVFVVARLELMTKERGVPRGHWWLPKLQEPL